MTKLHTINNQWTEANIRPLSLGYDFVPSKGSLGF